MDKDMLGRLVKNVKSAIQPGGDTPVAESGDELGKQMQDISELAKSIAKRHADLTQDVNDLSSKVSVLFDGVTKLRSDLPQEKQQAESSKGASSKKESKKESKDESKDE